MGTVTVDHGAPASRQMRVVLISTYDLGRQPFGLASPAAFLRRAGHDVVCVDVTRSPLPADAVGDAQLIAFFLPMHTATRLALPVIDRVRVANASAHLAAYGLYAPLNLAQLREHGVQTVLGPEFEQDLVRLAATAGVEACATEGVDVVHPLRASGCSPASVGRVQFIAPDRSDLPPLTRYASLQTGGTRKVVGYTEATRGCKHRCRHCPIVPVYDGRFRVVPVDVVLADIRAQVDAGAEHISFGDPDFLNGPSHSHAIVTRLAREFPHLTYDATIKVAHLRQHDDMLPILKETGCALVTTAVESFDDEVLATLHKGHTFADFEAVVARSSALGLSLSPTFVAFTPWTTIDRYLGMLRVIARLDLVRAVAPIQYAIRLLLPEGSLMLELSEVRETIERFDGRSLTHVWRHSDARLDALQREVERLVGSRLNSPRADIFSRVWALAHEAAGRQPPPLEPLPARATVPYLTEPWYC
jgi:radical SAM superfamily enzyme YgiQ (UPF0313 family)